jgi:hypothetical protein
LMMAPAPKELLPSKPGCTTNQWKARATGRAFQCVHSCAMFHQCFGQLCVSQPCRKVSGLSLQTGPTARLVSIVPAGMLARWMHLSTHTLPPHALLCVMPHARYHDSKADVDLMSVSLVADLLLHAGVSPTGPLACRWLFR